MARDKTTNGKAAGGGISDLRSSKSIQRLEQIASLRARGIGDNIDLPQLVVTGDPSAGKSSVLEGITGIPFPRDDGICTRFPTEVILEHNEGPQTIVATVIPHSSRSSSSKTTLKAFNRSMDDFSQLPDVIAAAGALMGVRGYGNKIKGPAFAEDVLRIKVTGPVGLHLSIVDLPGLIAVASEVQTDKDVTLVHDMVNSYIEKPRTIILAVVQAGNDIANQSIIEKSKEFDKAGQRTVGIITKPDLINVGNEARLACLAKNMDTTRLKLGFYLLKNPTPMEMKNGITAEQRAVNELRFFSSSPWKEQKLENNRVGIGKLKAYLQGLLDRHIEQELPKVRDEIKTIIKNLENEVRLLPEERPTPTHLRMYITDLAMRYHNIALAALNGDYHTGFADFFTESEEEIGTTRLRALVHNLNSGFADCMRRKGRKMQLIEEPNTMASKDTGSEAHKAKTSNRRKSNRSESEEGVEGIQQMVTKAEMKEWVKKTYVKTRGRELPGNYNHVLLTELYHYQSQMWSQIAQSHIGAVHEDIYTFLDKAMKHLNIEDYVLVEIQDRMEAKLEDNKAMADQELVKLIGEDKQQPITYNHIYTDNVQQSRLEEIKDLMQKTVAKVPVGTSGDMSMERVINMTPDTLINSLHGHLIVDMDEQACSEALVDLDAYYEVARKTFVDNVARQVVERHLLRNLPDIFTPKTVAEFTEDELERIAGERPEVVEKRKRLHEELKNLRAGLKDLRH